jgi:hypothetical protein
MSRNTNLINALLFTLSLFILIGTPIAFGAYVSSNTDWSNVWYFSIPQVIMVISGLSLYYNRP